MDIIHDKEGEKVLKTKNRDLNTKEKKLGRKAKDNKREKQKPI